MSLLCNCALKQQWPWRENEERPRRIPGEVADPPASSWAPLIVLLFSVRGWGVAMDRNRGEPATTWHRRCGWDPHAAAQDPAGFLGSIWVALIANSPPRMFTLTMFPSNLYSCEYSVNPPCKAKLKSLPITFCYYWILQLQKEKSVNSCSLSLALTGCISALHMLWRFCI